MEIESLIKAIIQCAYNVRTHLAAGFLENVYQKALMIELKEKGIHADTETPINVYYKNEIVGEFRADIIVEGEIIIELKAVQHLLPIHETQLVNYLTATNTDHGLLINFGGERIEIKNSENINIKITHMKKYVLLFLCLKAIKICLLWK